MNIEDSVHTPGKWRFRFVYGVALLLFLIAGGRLFYLTVVDKAFLQNQGEMRAVRTEAIPATRGMILDRRGEPLAVSTPTWTIIANPRALWKLPRDPSLNIGPEQEIKRLAEVMGVGRAWLQERFEANKTRSFMYLRRQIPPHEADAIMAANVVGVSKTKEYKRFYPAGEVASHVVGFTNIDDKGQEGIELAYDQALEGQPGRRSYVKDLTGNIIRGVGVEEAEHPGENIELSIDLRLQYLAYRELKAAVTEHRATSASAVILDVKTGEILAMVNQPSYNPNDRSKLEYEELRNRAVIDLFEPGSTMKPFTISAALMSDQYTTETTIDTSPGYLRFGRFTIRDAANYGVIDFEKLLIKSSNVGASKIALSLPQDAIWNMDYELGIGSPVGIGFPGEASGVLPSHPKWHPSEIATLAYGYGLSVSTLQLAQAYMTLANGGYRVPVTIFKQDVPADGKQVIPQKVAHDVVKMMESVVQRGSGKAAQIPGYRVAGKTGTVHKVGSKGYEYDQYIALFAGVAPASNPRLAMVVMINDPKGREYYGGEVAAPVFSRVMEGALTTLNIYPDLPEGLREVRLESKKVPYQVVQGG
ncbi:MAG: penicillin-binding protein 2 [Gammaproteobacteria bacterium]|jgi:cell division protein FtsI (penicillin-binding protein 3)|uniref:peptidoglycan D,D-transpeptidase FtsI family protein n=1 Tax=Marinomonas TaxID=28253 RepID=UPI000C1F2528|nr:MULTISPECIES: penicillin-binding protein 2 [unclassified Marinomonas]MBU1294334.1 penicillin-binding protein 2 [Gammaproteobacteria bacterium]MBU1468179.1 penicillin-binding protein 2 [Gammaproteobacteria bacterium]MBU2022130.1 penicillin-binding protein 2 [Gammaproteobacteria bacterium]MBU2237558.1 penicillin-binding protein 2 [Gammaproteobacteria bacterium]MBU2318379.1 penicillin-binding protein 2 [Gammaproteobacteria bacterium]|tara:strand:- start:3760 stop:5523 length:1764 start_codon:yes stop_codon:yes gene_type:complete